jgi:hypothetical protein
MPKLKVVQLFAEFGEDLKSMDLDELAEVSKLEKSNENSAYYRKAMAYKIAKEKNEGKNQHSETTFSQWCKKAEVSRSSALHAISDLEAFELVTMVTPTSIANIKSSARARRTAVYHVDSPLRDQLLEEIYVEGKYLESQEIQKRIDASYELDEEDIQNAIELKEIKKNIKDTGNLTIVSEYLNVPVEDVNPIEVEAYVSKLNRRMTVPEAMRSMFENYKIAVDDIKESMESGEPTENIEKISKIIHAYNDVDFNRLTMRVSVLEVENDKLRAQIKSAGLEPVV